MSSHLKCLKTKSLSCFWMSNTMTMSTNSFLSPLWMPFCIKAAVYPSFIFFNQQLFFMLYKQLAELYKSLEGTTLKARKTELVADFLEEHQRDDVGMLSLLVMGAVYPAWAEQEIGIASKLMIRAIARSYGISEGEVTESWKKTGDLGLVSEKHASARRQATLFAKPLEVRSVFENLKKVATLTGARSQEYKLTAISELLVSASPLEARYITRTVLGDLRVGVAEGLMRDAIANAFFSNVRWKVLLLQKQGKKSRLKELLAKTEKQGIIISRELEAFLRQRHSSEYKVFAKKNDVRVLKPADIKKLDLWKNKSKARYVLVDDAELGNRLRERTVGLVEHAYNMTNDFAVVAETAASEGTAGLGKLRLEPMRPVKVMLFQKADSLEDAFNTVGRPAAVEYKYDGFRLELHRTGGEIRLYTRRLEDVTRQFPDVVEALKKNVRSDSYMLDAEVIGIDPKTGRWLPFQKISRRIKRKYNIREMVKKIPMFVNVFDAVLVNGESLLKTPFNKRREKIAAIVKEEEGKIKLAEQLVTGDMKKADAFYQKALALGNEGVMVKNLKAPYKPGSRVGFGVKVKPTMENLDLVIIGAEYGTGKRGGWLSSYELACIDPETGEFLGIGKMGTGIKEKAEAGVSFGEITDLIRLQIVREEERHVTIRPSVMVEVAYEEIQKSPTYQSGFALRFPRLVRLRQDRSPDSADTIERVVQLYGRQRGKKK